LVLNRLFLFQATLQHLAMGLNARNVLITSYVRNLLKFKIIAD